MFKSLAGSRLFRESFKMKLKLILFAKGRSEVVGPWNGVELQVAQKNNDTANRQNPSPIPEEFMSSFNQIHRIIADIPGPQSNVIQGMPVVVNVPVWNQVPSAQFPGTLPSSGLFSPMLHTFYPHPHTAYYHATGMGQGWPSMPPLPMPCLYPPCLVHRPSYASDATSLAPSQANHDEDQYVTTAGLTAASQFQPRNLDTVDLFMRWYCDVVLNDIACDPYRNDVDEDIGLVVAQSAFRVA